MLQSKHTTLKMLQLLLLFFFFFPLPAEAKESCPNIEALLNPKVPAEIKNISQYQSQTVLSDNELIIQCDQKVFLKKLFHEVTKNEQTEMGKIKSWAIFLQKRLYHSCYPPVGSNSQAIYNPIWILKNQGVHCGQAARLTVDGFLAAGFKARLIQLNSHVVAEVWASDKYRMIDVDALDVAGFIYNSHGEIASVDDIFKNTGLVQSLHAYNKQKHYLNCTTAPPLPELYSDFFSKQTYGAFTTPFIYEKTSSPSQMKNIYYGWNYYHTKPYDN
jgi:hypothetical protein